MLRAVRYLLSVDCFVVCVTRDVCYLMLVVCCFRFVADGCCVLWRSLFAVCSLLMVACGLLWVVCCLWRVDCCLLFVVCFWHL